MTKYKCPKCEMEYDKPGKCAMDGVTLVVVQQNHKYKHADKHNKKHIHHDHHKIMMTDFKKRFVVPAAITIPILILSPLIQGLLGFSFTFAEDKYFLFTLSSFIFFWGGLPFLKGILVS